ncbi:MAG: response regulator transcription factor [Tissierellia bacterium]|nr:response regulator transcription factor [Tissierellia bacterium]
MDRKILVVDDEKSIADIIKFNLEKEGFTVELSYDGEDAIEKIYNGNPDLIILDIMLPKKDGFEVLKEIRTSITTPVLMLTAKEEEVDKVLGLELGADDYITKPFSMRELVARVKANLRRVEMNNGDLNNAEILRVGDLIINQNKYEVRKNGKIIDLTLREYDLLKFLASNVDQVFTRGQLLEKVWGYEYYGDVRTVDVTIRRLREKIEDKDGDYKYIMTKRGVGYYFRRG